MEQPEDTAPDINHCPECSREIDVSAFAPFAKIVCPYCEAAVRVRTTLGHYRIVSMLGEGGMSRVFKAEDVNLGREVALKILHQELSEDKALTAMFEREAKLTAAIQHPNVVKVYAVGRDQGYFFIAMELVDAVSLEQLIERKGAHEEETVLSIAHDVTSGLRAAYQSGLIHRDIKPGNMLVTGTGTTKLVDFGLAVQHGADDDSDDLWATPFYVPPEKLDGASDSFLGDIYSLGATLYHALAGEPPFQANTSSMEELKRIKAEAISLKEDAPGTSRATVKLVSAMMAYDPSGRPQNYDALLESIEEIQAKSFGTVHKRKRTRSERRDLLRKAGLAAAGLAAMVLLILLVRTGPDEEAFDDTLASKSDAGRVISAGENTNAEQFLEARSLLAQGNLARAEQIFSVLSGEASLSPSARAWTTFHRGLIALLEGDADEVAARFGELAQIDSFASGDPVLERQETFLRRVAAAMLQPLPPLPEDRNAYAAGSVEVLGWLAGGLKLWNAGQFAVALEWLETFAGSDSPPDASWIGEFHALVDRYRADFALFEQLPNPSMGMTRDELDSAVAALDSAMPQVRTGSALSALVELRRDRIGTILERKRAEAARLADARAREEERRERMKGEKGKAVPSASMKGASPAELAERERIVALRDTLVAEVKASGSFDGVVPAIEAETFETVEGRRLQSDLVTAFESGSRFLASLSEAVEEMGFEGAVRRREGRPLDAAITGATASVWIVDLGFGPNEVETSLLEPAWLLEVAGSVYPGEDGGDAALTLWSEAAWYAWASGLDRAAGEIASDLENASTDFAKRWERLSALESGGG